MNKKHVLLILASSATLTAIGMAVVAAQARALDMHYQVIMIALAVMTVLAAHFLLSLSSSWPVRVLWAGCMLAAIFNHFIFFTSAAESNNQIRSATPQVEQVRGRIAYLTTIESGITARPESELDRQLSFSHAWRERAALVAERTDSRRRTAIQDQIRDLQAQETELMNEVPVSQVLTGGIGAWTTIMGMFFAVLTELLGAVLWREYFALTVPVNSHEKASAGTASTLPGTVYPTRVHEETMSYSDASTPAGTAPSTPGTLAGTSGTVYPKAGTPSSKLPSIREIREQFKCGQARAMQIRKQLSCSTFEASTVH